MCQESIYLCGIQYPILAKIIFLAKMYNTVKPPIEDTLNNLPTKDNLKIPFYTNSIHNNLPTKDKRLGPERVHYSEISLYPWVNNK